MPDPANPKVHRIWCADSCIALGACSSVLQHEPLSSGHKSMSKSLVMPKISPGSASKGLAASQE